jgi:hypothetical protein
LNAFETNFVLTSAEFFDAYFRSGQNVRLARAAWLDAGLPSSYFASSHAPGIVPRPSPRKIAHVHG